ncbi:hypothetical protein CPB84DRAFT_345238 [Gymnopilus junonius]|uniref:Uncharacterized protein n=1 Tax=Gymnopilus junonius TaxID=109634 RepID=A0A9P5NUI3_GYMJU|nr:hypothetical protein CPB84DRAFT_345238 [Gymnopilus junonius]
MSEPMVSVIEDLLQLQQGELEMTLQGLHSILSWTETPVLTPRHGMVLQPLDPGMDESEGSWFRLMQEIHVYISNASVYDPKYGKIDITHASFVEFLVSRDRAGKYFIDSTDADSRIVAAGFYIMSNFILNSMRGNWRRPFSISTVLHMGRILYTNLSRLELLPESILDGISKIEDEFGKMDPALNTRVPVEGFVGIHLLITHTFRHIKVCSTNNTGLPEAFHQLSLVHQRYLRILYRLCENALFRKGLPLSIVPGLFAIRNDLSSEVLAYLFEIDKDIIEKHWKILGIDLELDGPSLLEKFFEYLPKMDLSTEENKQMCDRVHSRNVAFCSTVVLRFLSRSWADTPEPPKNVQRFIDGQFMYHLDELTLVPSNFDSALMLLDVLDGVKIHYSEVGTSSLYKLSCIWNLVKATLAWLAKLDQLSDGLKSFVFNKHVRYTFDRLFRQVFCVLRNSKGENEVSIREPFLGIERYLLKKKHFYWLSSEANIPYDPMTSNDPHTLESHYQITEERNTLFISDDLFLLDFNKLNLGNYLTDSQWARNLHISQDALYSSAFVYLDQVISKSNDNFDRIHETKKKMLLKTCTGYLQKECICDGSKKEEGSKDERNACVALQWSQYILTKLPGEYTFLEEKRTLHEIVTRHTD